MTLVHWSQTHGQKVKPSDSQSMEQPLSLSKELSHQCVSRNGATPNAKTTPTGGKQQ